MTSIYKRLPSALRAVLPWFIICICLMVLTGCFWIPTFEYQINTQQKDFRSMVGDEKSKRPLRLKAVQRKQVIALLGPPNYVSADNRAMGYLYLAGAGVWISPLCFSIEPASEHAYILRLTFDESDVLANWKVVQTSSSLGPLDSWDNNSTYAPGEAESLEKLDDSGPKLYPVGSPSTQPTTRGL